jgi:TIR domain
MKTKTSIRAATTRAWDFFVSYAQADEHWAQWMVWVLAQNGYSCFAQFADIPPGSDFVQEMNNGLMGSRQTIAILSPDYLSSKFAISELNATFGADPIGTKRRLVPVRVKECVPSGILTTRVYIDLVGKESMDAVNALIKGIEASRIAVPDSHSSFTFTKPPTFPGNLSSLGVNPHTPRVRIKRKPVTATKILLIASQRGTDLPLSKQLKAIERCLKEAIKSGDVVLDARYDVLAEDLAEVINEAAPQIVHFSGKQNGQRILVPTASGGVTTIAARALTGLFLNLADTVRLVIVDTCRSLPSALELCTTVDYAMGVEGDVYDDDATYFYSQLYSALGKGLSLKKAVGQASASLQMKGVSKQEVPLLHCREGVDPNSFRFPTHRV